jgi:alkylated DNA nucleotide flippase Atl1
MQEVAIPRTLDAAASVLTHAGPPEAAARVIGWSLANPLPVPTFLPRTRILEALRSEVVESLGQEEAERLMAEGAATPTADLVTSALAWLEAD